MNWAQGRLEHVVLHCYVASVFDLILFTGLSLTLIHVLVGEPRDGRTQPQRSLYGTTKVLRESALVSHA